MQNFTFHNPTRIHFGRGQIRRIDREIPADARVMLAFGGGSIKTNGVHEQVRAALGNRHVVEFGGIEANPDVATVERAIALVRAEKVDFLLAVGGGSVLDGVKLVAAAALLDVDPWAVVLGNVKPSKVLPIGSVMTLPATGSEMNGFSVISRRATEEKRSFGSPLLFPQFSILDPETTFSLPPRQIANGVVDAFVHVIEQYLTYPADAPLQDRFAEGILQTLVEIGPKTLADPTDYDARATFVWSATLALNGLIAAGVPEDWATHSIGHELTALHGLDHGQTLAVVLPALLDHQRDSKRAKLIQFAERLWGIREGSDAARIAAGIARMRAFFESMGVPTRLSDYGLTAAVAPVVAHRLAERGAVALGERKDVTPAAVEAILTQA
ncbi:MAG: iron-containing alcohol dehydrogenase, partial [Gemmatimonadales bacterium]